MTLLCHRSIGDCRAPDDGQKLVFRQIHPHKLGEDLHSAMDGAERSRQQELDEEVE